MSMTAVVCAEPGRLQVERRPRPARREGEVLIRVRRVGVCGTDMHIFRGTQPFLSYPRVMGHEFSGEVVEAPDGCELATGEPVYVMPYISCGACSACLKGKPNCCMRIEVLGVHRDGALAEYVSVPSAFVRSARGISLDAAAMIEFLAIGAHAIRRARIEPGQRVLVVGAGPIGIAAALFAKLAGGRVAALDARHDRLDFVRDVIGVDEVVEAGEGAPARLAALTDGDLYDVVFDATGSPAAMEAGFLHVAHGGVYVLISVVNADLTFNDPEFHRREMTLMGSRNATPEDFDRVAEAIRRGEVPVEALKTHGASLTDLPDVLGSWMTPEAGVIKAIVTC